MSEATLKNLARAYLKAVAQGNAAQDALRSANAAIVEAEGALIKHIEESNLKGEALFAGGRAIVLHEEWWDRCKGARLQVKEIIK